MSKWNFIAGHIVEGPKSRVVIGPDPDGLVACNDDGVLVPLTKDNPKLQLILAAPDMLEGLKSLWELRGQINYDSIIWKEVEQLITKAEGGE